MLKVLATIIFLLLTNTAAAQNNPPEVDEGIASIKKKTFDFSSEARIFTDDATPEFLLKYKNISLDYINHDSDKDFLKLKVDKEIFSLMGTGLDWNVALNGYNQHGENFDVLPSVGVNLYMRIRPRLDVYIQFSGLTLGRRGHLSDFESGIKYFPQKNFSISAGWRRVDFKLRRGGDTDKFVLSGVFTGVRYDF